MAEYQNIFTRVQVRAPDYAGVPLDDDVDHKHIGVDADIPISEDFHHINFVVVHSREPHKP